MRDHLSSSDATALTAASVSPSATAEGTPRMSRSTWLTVLAGATAFSVLYAAQNMLQLVVRDEQPDVPRVFALQLLPWLGWVALLPAIYRAVERWPLHDGGARRHWWRHLGLLVLVPLANTTLVMAPVGWLRGWWADGFSVSQAYGLFVINGAVGAVAQYVLVAAACHAHLAARRARREAVRAATLTAQVTDAELRALRAQLQPHFLFNTLNAITAHVRDEPDVAEEMLERLSALLRLVLHGASATEVPLAHELDAAGHYLGIHEIRFGSRLTVGFDVEPGVESALVPSMLLQPIVENAIQHGAALHRGPARIDVRASVTERRLELVVENTTAGPAEGRATPELRTAGGHAGAGVGLQNTRARLVQLYGDHAALRMESDDARTRIVIGLPLRFAPRASMRSDTPHA